MLIYDPSHHADPQITVVSEAGSPHATVMLDGVPVAQVRGGVGRRECDLAGGVTGVGLGGVSPPTPRGIFMPE